MLVASGFYLNALRPGDADNQQIAWAPATPESSPLVGATCDVAPLTTAEVMDMVMNPYRGYERLGRNTWPADLDSLSESIPQPHQLEPDTRGYRKSGNDPDLVQEAVKAANVFSACVATGTAYQVWALVDPSLVQIDVLSRFPVLRSEAELTAFVEETGPLSYKDYGGGYITRFGGQTMYQNEGNSIIDGPGNRDIAIIPMMRPDSESDGVILYLALEKFPNGQWIVNGFQYQIPSPQG